MDYSQPSSGVCSVTGAGPVLPTGGPCTTSQQQQQPAAPVPSTSGQHAAFLHSYRAIISPKFQQLLTLLAGQEVARNLAVAQASPPAAACCCACPCHVHHRLPSQCLAPQPLQYRWPPPLCTATSRERQFLYQRQPPLTAAWPPLTAPACLPAADMDLPPCADRGQADTEG